MIRHANRVASVSVARAALLLLCTGATGATGVASAASTYYVDTNNSAASDSNPGTQIQPWKTIGKAAGSMLGGDTTIVKAGTYNQSVSTVRSGAAGSRITFKAAGIVNTNSFTIGHDYITIDGFSLSSGSQFEVRSGNYCEILNNTIQRGWISFSYQYNPKSCLVRGNRLYGMTSPGGDAPQIQIFGTGHIIENNEIGPSSDIDAFRIFGSNHIIRNNYVHDITYSPGSAAHMDMFQTFGDNGWSSNNIVIENNKFINSQGQLFNTSQDGVAGIHDYIVRNNVFANISQNGNFGLPNFYFYNNTLYNTGILYLVTGGPGKPFNATNTVVRNNILIGVGGCNQAGYNTIVYNPSGLSLTRSNNFYSKCSGAPIDSFSEVGSKNGGSVNFVNVSSSDFSLNSPSAAIDAGTALSGFNYDIRGVTRPQGTTWDFGAFEYSAGSGSTAQLPPPLNLRVQ